MKAWAGIAMGLAWTVALATPVQGQLTGGKSYRVPFKNTNSQVWIAGEISGAKGSFLVDTGSALTIVDTKFARDAGLRTEGSSIAVPFIFYPRSEGRKASLETLEIGGFRFGNQSAVVADLSAISAHAGIRADGIIGMDTLCRLTLMEIDYEALHLTITPGERENCPSISPIIEITVNGRATRLLVDTGSRFGLTLFEDADTRPAPRVTLAEFNSANLDAQLVKRPDGVSEIQGLIGSGILAFLRLNFGERRTQILLRNPVPASGNGNR
jgi:predicted aspartyl protease